MDYKRTQKAAAVWKPVLLLSAGLLALSGCSTAAGNVSSLQDDQRAIDGGADYYSQFTNGLPDDTGFFPLALWHESLTDVAGVQADKSFGINTYVEVTPDSDTSLARNQDMYVLSSLPTEQQNGFVLPDEVDMWAKSGDGLWTGAWPGEAPVCEPEESRCGYTVMEQSLAKAPQGLAVYANFGKGVTFWDPDEPGKKFVNSYADIVSADNYWFTDPNICSQHEGGRRFETPRDMTAEECRLAANYGWTVERIRNLMDPEARKPVWGFVEIGLPFANGSRPIASQEIRAAVWQSIIAGARGIVYFNHSFGGTCQSQHVLRDCGTERGNDLAAINTEVANLAAVINAPVLEGAVAVNGPTNVVAKSVGHDLYILAGSAQAAKQETEFSVSCDLQGSVEAIGEGRTIRAPGGTFTDVFADGNAIHLYKLSGASC